MSMKVKVEAEIRVVGATFQFCDLGHTALKIEAEVYPFSKRKSGAERLTINVDKPDDELMEALKKIFEKSLCGVITDDGKIR